MSIQQKMSETLRQQRQILLVEPIHATVEPVRAYAQQLAQIKRDL